MHRWPRECMAWQDKLEECLFVSEDASDIAWQAFFDWCVCRWRASVRRADAVERIVLGVEAE